MNHRILTTKLTLAISFLGKEILAMIGEDGICRTTNCAGSECIFTVKVDLMAGELGYYTFEECGDTSNPTIGVELGQTYRFIQSDKSNWYHPLGFAYYADGAHDDVDELEPGISGPYSSDDSCAEDLSCPAPMYFIDDEYLGTYSNIPEILAASEDEGNFGLDDFEPLFFHPLTDWTGYGEFSVALNYPEKHGFQGDFFYFCHIHQYMTGRAKLLKDGVAINPDGDVPEIPYDYDVVSDYDSTCGTFGLNDFQLYHPECPDRFVCDVASDNPGLAHFSGCIESMNCHMFVGMTTNANSNSEGALFMHQMIPHHQNAVNMAKAMLKTGSLECDDVDEETDDCAFQILLREMINTQNHQIQIMAGLLDSYGYPESDDCTVPIASLKPKKKNKKGGKSKSKKTKKDRKVKTVRKYV